MIRYKMRWLVLLVVAGCFLLPPSGAYAFLSPQRGLYGMDHDTKTIYKLNAATGVPTPIGSLGVDMLAGGMAYDASTGTMYLVYASELMRRDGSRSAYFSSIDLETGDITIINGDASTHTIMGMTYDSTDDLLYGADVALGNLVTFDRSTGAVTVVGPFDSAAPLAIQGLAYCPANDTLYGIDMDNVYTIDRATGEATAIGPHGMTASLMGLVYNENTGMLNAVTYATEDLYRINLETGQAFVLGSLGVQLQCLASVPTQGALNVLYVNVGVKDGALVDGLEGMDIDGLSLVSAGSITPLPDYLDQFDVVLVASAGNLADPELLGDRLADYVDAGGGLGIYAGALASGGDHCLGGRIVLPEYSPLAPAEMDHSPSTADTIISHDITDGVVSITSDRVMHQLTVQGDGIPLGTYDTGYLLGAYSEANPIAVINVFPSDLEWSGDLILMTENLIHWCVDHAAVSSGGGFSLPGGGGGGGGCFISGLVLP